MRARRAASIAASSSASKVRIVSPVAGLIDAIAISQKPLLFCRVIQFRVVQIQTLQRSLHASDEAYSLPVCDSPAPRDRAVLGLRAEQQRFHLRHRHRCQRRRRFRASRSPRSNSGTGITRTSVVNSAGHYEIQLLPPGTYSVSSELSGFQPLKYGKIVVNVGTDSR